MSFVRVPICVLAMLSVLALTGIPVQAEEKAERKAEFPAVPSHEKAQAPAKEAPPAFCYFTPLGSFDLKEGVFLYVWPANHCDHETGVKYVKEDANYYYFQERTQSWWWAFGKNAVNGRYYVWWTGGNPTYQLWSSSAIRVAH